MFKSRELCALSSESMLKICESVFSDKFLTYEEAKKLEVKFAEKIEKNQKRLNLSDTTVNNIKNCSDELIFKTDHTLQNKKLYKRNGCNNRMCPFCCMIESEKKFMNLMNTLNTLKLMYGVDNFDGLFLTLTIPSTKAIKSMMNSDYFKLQKAIRLFLERKEIKALYKDIGYINKGEFNYHEDDNTINLHKHILFLMKPGTYFLSHGRVNKDLYVEQVRFQKIWSKCCEKVGLTKYKGQMLQVNIQRMQCGAKDLCEIVKYTTKSSDVVDANDDAFCEIYQFMKYKKWFNLSGKVCEVYNDILNNEIEVEKEEVDFEYLITSKFSYRNQRYEITDVRYIEEEKLDEQQVMKFSAENSITSSKNLENEKEVVSSLHYNKLVMDQVNDDFTQDIKDKLNEKYISYMRSGNGQIYSFEELESVRKNM